MENLNETLEKITEFLKSEVKTDTIIGAQFKLGDFTCVPVMSVGIGLGGGRGEGKSNEKNTGEGSGIGGGLGMGLGPVGFLATTGNEIQFIPTRSSKGLSSVFEKLPGLVEKFMEKKTEKA